MRSNLPAESLLGQHSFGINCYSQDNNNYSLQKIFDTLQRQSFIRKQNPA